MAKRGSGASIAGLSTAVELYNAGRFADALAAFRAVGTPDALLFSAHCLDSLGRVDEAVAVLRGLARRGAGRSAASLALAAILRREGRPGVEDCLRRAVRADPRNAEARKSLEALEAEARERRALELRRSALEQRDAGRLERARILFMKLPPSPERAADLTEIARLEALKSEEARRWTDARKVWRRLAREPGRAEEARTRLLALELRAADDELSTGADARRRLLSLLARCASDAERTPVLERLRAAARALEKSGRDADAEALLRSIERRGPESDRSLARAQRLDLLARRVHALRRAGKLALAQKTAHGLVSLSGGSERFRKLAGALAVARARKLDGSERARALAASDAYAIRPREATRAEGLQLLMRGAEVELQRGGLAAASAIWTAAVARLQEPLTIPERDLRFRLLVALGDYRGAFAEGERALDAGAGSDERALGTLGNPWAVAAAYLRGEQDVLERDCRTLDALAGAGEFGPWPHFYLSLLAHRVGRDDWREVVTSAAERAGARHAFMLPELARARLVLGEPEAALESALAAAAALPAIPGWTAHCYAAEAELALGRGPAGVRRYDDAVALSGRFRGDALAWKGEGLLWLGRYAEAEEALARAVEAGGAPYAYCWLGAARFKLGRPEKALADLDRGLAVYNRDLESYAWRAEVLLALGRPEEAVLSSQAEPLRAGFDGALCLPDDLSDGRGETWRWHLAARARARLRLKDEAGARADYAALPPWFRSLAGESDPAGSPERLDAALARLQDLAGGCRRPERYPDAVWAGPSVLRRGAH